MPPPPPSLERIQGLTFATVSDEQRRQSRAVGLGRRGRFGPGVGRHRRRLSLFHGLTQGYSKVGNSNDLKTEDDCDKKAQVAGRTRHREYLWTGGQVGLEVARFLCSLARCFPPAARRAVRRAVCLVSVGDRRFASGLSGPRYALPLERSLFHRLRRPARARCWSGRISCWCSCAIAAGRARSRSPPQRGCFSSRPSD